MASIVCLWSGDELMQKLFDSDRGYGPRWGDIMYEWELEHGCDTPSAPVRTFEAMQADADEQRMREYAERLRAAAAAKASAEASEAARRAGLRRNEALAAAAQAAKAASVAAPHKMAAPCKWLYCPPNTKDVFVKNVCSECWGHEYKNPKTGRVEKPHSCNRLHPGEPGWKAEWNALSVPANRFRVDQMADKFSTLRR